MSNDDILQVQDLRYGKLNVNTIAEVAMVGTTADTTTNREGVVIDTLEGRLKKVGFEPPLPYAAGITFADAQDAVKSFDRDGIVYGCLASSRPFTTTGNFQNDSANFFVIQDISEIGDVRTNQDNAYDAGTTQSMPKLLILGVDVGEELIAQSIIQSQLVSDVSANATAASSAQSIANTANNTANTANNTANAAQTTANSKISQAQGDARYLKPFSATRKDFANFQIISNGAALGAPTGWTTSEEDDGRYRVIHNTGQSVFPVVTVVNDANNAPQKTASIVYVNNNAFDITIEDTPTDKLLNVMVTY